MKTTISVGLVSLLAQPHRRRSHLPRGVRADRLSRGRSMPAVAQDPSYHRFADQRQWLGVPNAADVLSNLAFALVGLVGVVRLASPRRPRFSPATEAGMWCVALGLVCHGDGLGVVSPRSDRRDPRLGSPADDAGVRGRPRRRDRATRRQRSRATEPRPPRPAGHRKRRVLEDDGQPFALPGAAIRRHRRRSCCFSC